MIEFRSSKYRRNKGVNILKYDEIEYITKTLLQDYDDTYLKEPKALDVEDFACNYLEASDVDYQYICNPLGKETILGATTFEDCNIEVFNKEKSTKEVYRYKKHSIILSRELVEGTRTAQYGITGFHECGHLYLHKDYYSSMAGQISMNIDSQKKMCTRSQIEKFAKKNMLTTQDWIEWQATTFAATIALNADSVAIAMNDIMHRNGIKDNVIIEDVYANFEVVNNYIPAELRDIFGISKEAIIYRLRKLGYYKTKASYETEKSQMTIYDFM